MIQKGHNSEAKLSALAKEIAKGDFRAYLNEAYEKISADKGSYHEEIML